MILRKPYAFLIKHFKLLNLILCSLLVYIVFKTNDILYFFTDYINSGYYVKIGDVVGDYISIQLYIVIFITLVISLSITVLLHVKEKSNLAYELVFILYVIVAVLVVNAHINLYNMQVEVIDYRKIRLFKDLLFISMFLQYISIIFTLIRGIGLNIKKFNFDKEIEELEISSSDNAEFELKVDLNTSIFSRNMRRRRRYIRYFIKEHKSLFKLISTIFVLIVSVITFINIGKTTLMHKENMAVKINDNTIVVNKTYITDKDYSGKVISDKYNYFIVGFNIKNNGSEISGLDTDNFKLIINKNIYSPIKSDEKKFFDFGEYYKSNKIKPKTVMNYILVFKISNEDKNAKNYIFRYNASQVKNSAITDKNFDIKLNPVTYFVNKEISSSYLNNDLSLEQSILGNTILRITNYDIQDYYDVKYDYCISKNQCDKIQYKISPEEESPEEELAVLKLETTILYDNIITSSSILDKSNLISKLAKIVYTKEDNNERKIAPINLTIDELRKDSTIYLQVDKAMKDAKKIKLILDIRGYKYTYILLDEENE